MSVVGDLLTSTLAALAFIPCAMAQRRADTGPQPRRREVVVNGKRVKTIDVHAHCIVPAAAAVINHPLEAPGPADARHQHAHRGDGRAGHRRRGAEHQPLLVSRPIAMPRPS